MQDTTAIRRHALPLRSTKLNEASPPLPRTKDSPAHEDLVCIRGAVRIRRVNPSTKELCSVRSSATGLRFTKDSVSPTEDRVKALKERKESSSTSSHCCSFLCTVLWSSQFKRNVLCRLTKIWSHLAVDRKKFFLRWGHLDLLG